MYGIRPDLSTFGKALGNGFAVAALVGRRELMERGGTRHDRERVFLLSTTHGAETHALAAAMAVIRVYRQEGVVEQLEDRGTRLRLAVDGVVKRHGLERHIRVLGRPQNLVFATLDADRAAVAAIPHPVPAGSDRRRRARPVVRRQRGDLR